MDWRLRTLCWTFLLACGVSSAEASPRELPRLTEASVGTLSEMVAKAKGRPNEEYRLHGLIAYAQRDYKQAVRHFERAAFHADKYAQHYLSLMHWHGIGAPVDHVLGYAWSDLAAERGTTKLLLLREKMWQELSLDEQSDVGVRGAALYVRYGDSAAQRRTENAMRRFASNMTGSRVGWGGQLEVAGRPSGGSFEICGAINASGSANVQFASAADLYGIDFDQYWRQQDLLIQTGSVEIGPVEPIRSPTP
ncbi:hypothetical protein [Lysobacter olei]